MIRLRPGVLARHQILELVNNGVIKGVVNLSDQIGPSAIDLTMSFEGWEMHGSTKGRSDRQYDEVVGNHEFYRRKLNLRTPTLLERHKTYVIRLNESLDLSNYPHLHAYGSGKSSIGRLDVLVRLVADYSAAYDEVNCYETTGQPRVNLYVEITPISFPIMVAAGVSLNQLRFSQGDVGLSELSHSSLVFYRDLLLTKKGTLLPHDRMRNLTVDVTPVIDGSTSGLIAFEASENYMHPIDLVSPDVIHLAEDYWLPVTTAEHFVDSVRIVPERFYILRSHERFRLPCDIAAFVQAVTETIGELRIHYAGFIHPGFGLMRDIGTPLIFEIRGHNTTTFLRDGEPIAVIRYFKMSEPVREQDMEHSYQQQELTLSRYFTTWKGK